MGKLNLNKQYINVFILIEQVIKDLNSLLMEKQIDTRIKCKSFLDKKSKDFDIMVYCDICKIEQVLSNLIKNSIDFVSEKVDKIIIYVEKDKMSNELFVSVEDNGIGIPEDKIEFIFKKFYQIQSNVKKKTWWNWIGFSNM